jgi:hypothetical protein
MVPVVEEYLADVYVDVFVNVYNNRLVDCVHTMKLLRKLWMGTLYNDSIEKMRIGVYAATGMDIDCGFDKKSIEVVRNHYAQRLSMP